MEQRMSKPSSISLIGRIPNHYSLYLNILKSINSNEIYFITNKSTNLTLIEYYPKKVNIKILSNNLLYLNYKNDFIILDEPFEFIDIIKVLLFTPKNKTYLIIHNINKWFNPKINRAKKFSQFDKFKELARLAVVNRIRNYIVVSSTLQIYCQKNFLNKNFSFVPFGNEIQNLQIKNNYTNNIIKVAIPGTISQARNYSRILKLISSLDKLNIQYEFIFLGKPIGKYGKEIITLLESLNLNNIIIKTFNEFISNYIFQKELIDSDIIFSDFNINYISKEGYFEYYGKTKETGISSIAIDYCKPIIIPNEYNLPQEINSQSIKFHSFEDCIKIFKDLYENKQKIKFLKKEAIANNILFYMNYRQQNIFQL